jgi:predicted nucleic acid-binding protein
LKVGLDSSVLVASVKRVGEKHRADSLRLSELIKSGSHTGVCSALAMIEIAGALSSSTTMPLGKIYDIEASLIDGFRIRSSAFEPHSDMTVELMLEFRELKRKFGIGSAGFHHLATASSEGCGIFATTDERHLLRPECRNQLSKYVRICSPAEAAESLTDDNADLPSRRTDPS